MPADSPTSTRTAGLPSAVLWDMDGTLVDTEPYWIRAEHAIVEEHGGVWSEEYAHELVGVGGLARPRQPAEDDAVPGGGRGCTSAHRGWS